MKGVYTDEAHGGWVASYGRDLKKHFKNEESAKTQRKEWEQIYGIPTMGGQGKDYSGIKTGNFKVIGNTNEYKNHSQLLVVRNQLTHEVRTITAVHLLSGNAKGNFGYSRKQKNNKTGYPGVLRKKSGPHKGKYFGAVTINKHTYVTSYFDLPKEAYQTKQKILIDYLQKGVLPYPAKTKAKSGHKYITYDSRKNRAKRYVVDINNKTGKCRKAFLTLSEALAYRNQWLTDHNLPIPD